MSYAQLQKVALTQCQGLSGLPTEGFDGGNYRIRGLCGNRQHPPIAEARRVDEVRLVEAENATLQQ